VTKNDFTLALYVQSVLAVGGELFAEEDPAPMQIAKYDDWLRGR